MKSLKIFSGLLFCWGVSSAQQYVISTIAGGAPPPSPRAASHAPIGSPSGVAIDSDGNVYFASSNLSCVFKLDSHGVVTLVAGNSRAGYSGDGGPAVNASLNGPVGLAVDKAGNLFIADIWNRRVRKVSASGIITTVAGNGVYIYNQVPGTGIGGPAVNMPLNSPHAVAVDSAGNLFIADSLPYLLKVTPRGIITAVFGGFAGLILAVDAADNLYVEGVAGGQNDYGFRIFKLSPTGIVTTVAGGGSSGPGDGGPATSAQLSELHGIAVDSAGDLFFTEAFPGDISRPSRVRMVSPNGIITTIAGKDTGGFSGDGGRAINALLAGPIGIAVDAAGNLFIADSGNNRIREISTDGIISTVAGDGTLRFSGDGGFASSALLSQPGHLTIDRAGSLFIADAMNFRVRKVSPMGIITTVAGSGTWGFPGDGGLATSASLENPVGMAVDTAGNLFIADFAASRVRKVSTDGIITTVAGNGKAGYGGDGGLATNAVVGQPSGVAIDGADNLFIAEFNVVRKVDRNGIITTAAGGGTLYGAAADGGLATKAAFFVIQDVAVDSAGNLFILTTPTNHPPTSEIRRVSTNGIITTITRGTRMNAMAIDGAGNFFVSTDVDVREVTPSGVITTTAGYGIGFSGDGGPATFAQLSYPGGVAVDGNGNVYVADSYNNAIRLLRPTNHSVLIGAVVDAASQAANPVAPGKIVVIYGAGLGPAQLTQYSAANGVIGTQLGGTTVYFDGIAAPILYTSANQVAAIVPYSIAGNTALVTVAYQGETSAPFSVLFAASAPSLFTANETGAGQASAINVARGILNTAFYPVIIGEYISLFATGEGQTRPAGVDGKFSTLPLPQPNLLVTATVGGIPATVQYAGAAFGSVAGLMQVNLLIPPGVEPGGYVPVIVKVGNAASSPAVWIAVTDK